MWVIFVSVFTCHLPRYLPSPCHVCWPKITRTDMIQECFIDYLHARPPTRPLIGPPLPLTPPRPATPRTALELVASAWEPPATRKSHPARYQYLPSTLLQVWRVCTAISPSRPCSSPSTMNEAQLCPPAGRPARCLAT